jgi:hypothetical protein
MSPPQLTQKERAFQSYQRGNTTAKAIHLDTGIPLDSAAACLSVLRREKRIPLTGETTVESVSIDLEQAIEAVALRKAAGEPIGQAIDTTEAPRPRGRSGRNENLDRALAKLGYRVLITQVRGEDTYWPDDKIVGIPEIMEAAGMVRG